MVFDRRGSSSETWSCFDRYGLEFRTTRYQEILPDGVACGGLTPVEWDPGQLAISSMAMIRSPASTPMNTSS